MIHSCVAVLLLLLICAGVRASDEEGSLALHPVIAIVAKRDAGVSTAIGEVTKHPQNPLFEQDKPWEPRLDNGYPNVVYDPHEPLGAWRMWYGDCVKGCGTQILLYANSTDGLSWEKPELGIYDVGWVRPDLASYGKNNNIVMKGGGIGVYLDPHEKNASRRFKGFGGVGCFGADGKAGCVDGMGTSADGLHWGDAVPVHWPAPDRYDCHNNIIWDEKHNTYLATTRDGFSGNPGRTIAIARSTYDEFHWDTSKAPPEVEAGDAANQLYSQITFVWPGMETQVYLGIVMVFDAQDASGFVHCRLSWSTEASKWQWVDPGGLTGRDFIPLGVRPGEGPPSNCTGKWEPVPADHNLSDCQAYQEGHKPGHYICSGEPVAKDEEVTLDMCRSRCAEKADCGVMHWQGQEKYNYSVDSPGQCFMLKECGDVKPYESHLAPTFCMETEWCTERPPSPPPSPNAFDSHVCFAAAQPVAVPGEGVRVYYMGGNGPHSGTRNSSLGLATLRPDRFAGLSGTGFVNTTTLNCSGRTLMVTADVMNGGSVRVGILDVEGLSVSDSVAIKTNATNQAVLFRDGKDLSSLIGKSVAITIELDNAIVYTVGFGSQAALPIVV